MDKAENKSPTSKKQIRENTQKLYEQIRDAIEFCIEEGFSCFVSEYPNEIMGIGYKEMDSKGEVVKSIFGVEVFIKPNEDIDLKLVDLNRLNDLIYLFIAFNDIEKTKEVLMLESVYVTDDWCENERIFHIYFDFKFISKYIIRKSEEIE